VLHNRLCNIITTLHYYTQIHSTVNLQPDAASRMAGFVRQE